ncbi:hypothetical protein [Georgenia thermotolerans]|uniref:DUF892 family protein n=1 Tax=Georgenia thermotolerans TaxID=527326 RepID=A0A7J5UR56_9MICO|nr:hypothetical protein [Georgenia thermotolerans]KAE8764829.1 hypothetical protein GB883_06800 [Georgenia thermotolerans]
MSKIDTVLEETHEHENELHLTLLRVSERHKTDHEIYHVARDLAAWSAEHVRRLAEAGKAYGLDLDAEPKEETTLGRSVREKAGEALGRHSQPGMRLLRDLRELHLQATEVSLDWELLGQAAQATKDRELLALTKECHPDTLRQSRWANTMLKSVSPQVLAS